MAKLAGSIAPSPESVGLGLGASRLETRTEDCNDQASLCALKHRGVGKPNPSTASAEGASDEGAELGRCYPMARDLRVGRAKPLETAVEARSSSDPQIVYATCA